MFNLRNNELNCLAPSTLVKRSASWAWVETYEVRIQLRRISSRTGWQLISICFVRSWKTGLLAIWSAAWLSQLRCRGFEWEMPRVERMSFNHFNSLFTCGGGHGSIFRFCGGFRPCVVSWSTKRPRRCPRKWTSGWETSGWEGNLPNRSHTSHRDTDHYPCTVRYLNRVGP